MSNTDPAHRPAPATQPSAPATDPDPTPATDAEPATDPEPATEVEPKPASDSVDVPARSPAPDESPDVALAPAVLAAMADDWLAVTVPAEPLVVEAAAAAAAAVLPVPVPVSTAAAQLAWAIDAYDLVKTYRGRRRGDPRIQAVRGVSLRVPAGTIFGLLGPNGAGKSTTVRMLATLSRPDSGTATVAGHDVLRQPWDVRRSIGIVPQKTGADLDATGRENLLLQGRLYGLGGVPCARRAAELLARFDLDDAADRLARTYSGGMLRRLDVAIGLVQRPSVLFLDEPTTGLDPQARAVMWAEIEALTADGLSILLTTHYLEEADRLATRVAIVDSGRVVVEGSPDELKSELRGDAVDVSVADEPTVAQAGELRARLVALPGVVEVVFDGRTVRTRVNEGAAKLPAIFGGGRRGPRRPDGHRRPAVPGRRLPAACRTPARR